jgi:hypothetical protein
LIRIRSNDNRFTHRSTDPAANPPRPHASQAFVQNKERAPAGRFLPTKAPGVSAEQLRNSSGRRHQVSYSRPSYGALWPTRWRGNDVLLTSSTPKMRASVETALAAVRRFATARKRTQ